MNTSGRFLGSILQSAFAFEAARIRLAPAIRRTAVLGLVMGIVGLWFGWGLAVGAGVGALLVGMLELQQPRRERWQTMTLGTLGLAIVTCVTHLLAPFHAAILLVFVAIAFAEGASISLHRNAPVVLHLMGLTVATVLLNPMRTEDWIAPTLAVLFGGGVQTGVTYAFDRFSRYDFQRSASQNSLMAVAEALRRTAAMQADPSRADRAYEAVEYPEWDKNSLDMPKTEIAAHLLKAQAFAQRALREGQEVGPEYYRPSVRVPRHSMESGGS